VKYTPIRSRWIVLAFFVTVVLAALCQAGAGSGFEFPRLLWYLPFIVLDAIGVSLAAALLGRYRRRHEGD